MSFQHRQLTACLRNGAIIAYPTETVWGLGCLPNNDLALQHLADLKQRSVSKGFILVSPNIELCLPYIDTHFHNQAIKNITLNTQKPTTWLAPKSKNISILISGQFNTVAIRISPHPFIKTLCHAVQMPLVSTSANINSRPSLNSALLVQRFLGKKLNKIIYGYNNGTGQASRIIHCQSMRLIRS